MIIDDGWLSARDELLYDFVPDKENGFAWFVIIPQGKTSSCLGLIDNMWDFRQLKVSARMKTQQS